MRSTGDESSGYHQHFRRRASPEQRKRLSNDALLVHIRAIHTEVKGEYGWPRVWKELLFRGLRVGKDRVRKLMALHDIKARGKKKYKVTSDITYIATAEGWLYLAAVIDLFSRQIVGWSMQPSMKKELVIDALRMAWFRRHPAPGLIFHSDRGRQYCSADRPL